MEEVNFFNGHTLSDFWSAETIFSNFSNFYLIILQREKHPLPPNFSVPLSHGPIVKKERRQP